MNATSVWESNVDNGGSAATTANDRTFRERRQRCTVRPDARANRCRRLCGRSRIRRAHRGPPAHRARQVGRGARGARPRRRTDLDRTPLRRHAGRPRRRVVGAESTTPCSASPGELGVATYKTWVKGAHLLVDGERTRRYTGLIPKISPLAIVTIALAQWKIDRMAKQVPVEAPWTAKRAEEWDSRSIAWWLDALGNPQRHRARPLRDGGAGPLPGRPERRVVPPPAVPRARRTAASTRCSRSRAERRRTWSTAAPGSMAKRIADDLGDAVRLNAPVRSITQHDDRVVVEAGELVISARHAVVTVPPALALEISVRAGPARRPPDALPQLDRGPGVEDARRLRRAVLARRRVQRSDLRARIGGGGHDRRVTVVGDAGRASRRSRSARPRNASTRLDPAERRRAVLDALTRPARAARRVTRRSSSRPRGVDEEWTRGCSMAHFRPGILTRYGPLLREPFGRVHWAGTETATTSHGAIDGAVRSGERAAAEILARE